MNTKNATTVGSFPSIYNEGEVIACVFAVAKSSRKTPPHPPHPFERIHFGGKRSRGRRKRKIKEMGTVNKFGEKKNARAIRRIPRGVPWEFFIASSAEFCLSFLFRCTPRCSQLRRDYPGNGFKTALARTLRALVQHRNPFIYKFTRNPSCV